MCTKSGMLGPEDLLVHSLLPARTLQVKDPPSHTRPTTVVESTEEMSCTDRLLGVTETAGLRVSTESKLALADEIPTGAPHAELMAETSIFVILPVSVLAAGVPAVPVAPVWPVAGVLGALVAAL